jgi:hypothetical protein
MARPCYGPAAAMAPRYTPLTDQENVKIPSFIMLTYAALYPEYDTIVIVDQAPLAHVAHDGNALWELRQNSLRLL